MMHFEYNEKEDDFPPVTHCLKKGLEAIRGLQEGRRMVLNRSKATFAYLHAVRQIERECTNIMMMSFGENQSRLELEFLRELYLSTINSVMTAMLHFVASDGHKESSLEKAVAFTSEAIDHWDKMMDMRHKWVPGPESIQ